ncbi:MAG: histidinol-phosphate transaminase [Coriobacteriales bacterium]|nr:histidinol-phosphate transaminase [Coriobacteriales bacterium]
MSDMLNLRDAARYLTDLEPYDPQYLPARIYLSANENPYGLPPEVKQALVEKIGNQTLHRYPDPLAKDLRAQLALLNGVDVSQVLVGNGGDELLYILLLAYGGKGRLLLNVPPSFSAYHTDAKLTKTGVVDVPRLENGAVDEAAVLARVRRGDIDVVMLASPNNPTGECARLAFLLELLEASDALVLVDHAYIEFADPAFDLTRFLADHRNLAILRTFSKAYALAGVRLGYLLADPVVIRELLKVRQPYSVDVLSALAGSTVLAARERMQQGIDAIVAERERTRKRLRQMAGVTVFASDANFLLLRVADAHTVWEQLYERYGILVRDFSRTPGLADCLRVSIGSPQEMDEFLDALQALRGA